MAGITEPLDRDALESKWQANERELNRIAASPGLDRELLATDVERLEDEQEWIEWSLGFDHPTDARTRRWSGMP